MKYSYPPNTPLGHAKEGNNKNERVDSSAASGYHSFVRRVKWFMVPAPLGSQFLRWIRAQIAWLWDCYLYFSQIEPWHHHRIINSFSKSFYYGWLILSLRELSILNLLNYFLSLIIIEICKYLYFDHYWNIQVLKSLSTWVSCGSSSSSLRGLTSSSDSNIVADQTIHPLSKG